MSPVIELIFGVEWKDGKREVMRSVSLFPVKAQEGGFLYHRVLCHSVSADGAPPPDSPVIRCTFSGLRCLQ